MSFAVRPARIAVEGIVMKNSDSRGMWAGMLAALGIGVAGCAVCCAPPLVVAIGVLGASGAAGAILGWWLPIVGALMVAAAVLVVLVPKRRSWRRSEDGESAGCGCAQQRDVSPDGRPTLAP